MRQRIYLSLGRKAPELVKEAVAHAAENPTHDPVVICTVDEEQRERRISLLCYGDESFGDGTLCLQKEQAI